MSSCKTGKPFAVPCRTLSPTCCCSADCGFASQDLTVCVYCCCQPLWLFLLVRLLQSAALLLDVTVYFGPDSLSACSLHLLVDMLSRCSFPCHFCVRLTWSDSLFARYLCLPVRMSICCSFPLHVCVRLAWTESVCFASLFQLVCASTCCSLSRHVCVRLFLFDFFFEMSVSARLFLCAARLLDMYACTLLWVNVFARRVYVCWYVDKFATLFMNKCMCVVWADCLYARYCVCWHMHCA